MMSNSDSDNSREWMIHSLVQYQAERIGDGECGLWLLNILESGFAGFCNMPDEQLEMELKKRGLYAEFEEPDMPADEDDDERDEDFNDEDEVRSMRSLAFEER